MQETLRHHLIIGIAAVGLLSPALKYVAQGWFLTALFIIQSMLAQGKLKQKVGELFFLHAGGFIPSPRITIRRQTWQSERPEIGNLTHLCRGTPAKMFQKMFLFPDKHLIGAPLLF